MRNLVKCRRSIVALVSIISLTYLGYRGMDVAMAIAAVSAALGGANAYSASKGATDGVVG